MSGSKDPKQRFSSTVANYRRFRPGYPMELMRLLHRRVGLSRGTRVADLGAGTGLLTRPLLQAGARVIAVEPNEAMRMASEDELGAVDGFHSIDGSAESTQLPEGTVEGVLAGQAFHWFDAQRARTEALRIGEPDVWAAIIWNTRRLHGSDFLEAYEAFCQTWGTDYTRVAAGYAEPQSLRTFFGGDSYTREAIDNEQQLDREGLHGRLLSCSYFPGPEHTRYRDMLSAINELFDAHQAEGRVRIAYDTEVYWGKLAATG